MKSTCLNCGAVGNLPEGHRLIVCLECGAVQTKVGAVSSATEYVQAPAENDVRPVEKLTLPLMQMEMRVSEHLIECNQITYQIKNLTATAVRRYTVPIDVPEPTMKSPAPSHGTGTAVLIGGIAGCFCFALLAGTPVVGFVFGLVVFAVAAIVLNGKFRAEIEPWKRSAARVNAQHERWSTLQSNPIILYSVVLETNAGSSPIFHSTEQAEIVRANETIKDAMSRKIVDGRSLSIKVLDLPFTYDSKSFDAAIGQLAATVGRQYVYRTH